MDNQVLGANLRRFMKLTTDANTIKLLNQKSSVSTASISNILNGKTCPSADILMKLAEALGRTTDELLRPIASLKSLRFRTNKQMTAREKAQKDTLLCTLAEWMQTYASFCKISPIKTIYDDILNISNISPQEAAKKVRSVWGIGKNDPIYNLENYIVNSGIKLLGIPFGFKQTFGLSVGFEDGGPAIIVNTDQTISGERRIFTLAHELGHIILHSSSFGNNEGAIEDSTSVEEREADTFASYLLMPEEAFKDKLTESKNLGLVESILKIKRYFGVSYKTVIYRMNKIYGDERLNMNFAYLFNQKYHHNLQNHYEPFSLGEYEFTNTSTKANVFNSVKDKKISLQQAGFLLGIDDSKISEEYKFWEEEIPFSNEYIS